MADKKRGGRSADDEFEDDAIDAELDDTDVDDGNGDEPDFDDDELDEDTDRPAARSGGRSRSAIAKSRTAARGRTKEDRRVGPIGRIPVFVREVVAELQKVIWPTRKELLTYTTVVVIFVAIMMTYVSLLDFGFLQAMFVVFGGKSGN